jgi:MFS family permease
MLGYGGGFVGPLVVGWTLDFYGGDTLTGWAASYGVVAVLVVAGLLAFRLMQPQDLAHDRPSRTA